ncbi:hypothetical protein PG994_004110 [Apiospora phragmitis]|uniref:Uncharacterized protein n=1 Tax=Apiospora phragmitis TaxID=2905665 RepID=A0ABR1VPN2_9PEZI
MAAETGGINTSQSTTKSLKNLAMHAPLPAYTMGQANGPNPQAHAAVGKQAPSRGSSRVPLNATTVPANDADTVANPVVASWALEIRALSEEQRGRFLKEMPPGDLHSFANMIEKTITQRTKSSRTLQASKWMAPLGQLVDMTKPFADTVQSAFPLAGLTDPGRVVILPLD